jgi:DNA-binding response OmpR family regulator
VIRPTLRGHSILVVEDEALIAIDIAFALEKVGAQVATARTIKDALALAEHEALSAAIVDRSLKDGDSGSLCERLEERGIPYLVYSGFLNPEDNTATHVAKPAIPQVLIATLEALLRNRQILS